MSHRPTFSAVCLLLVILGLVWDAGITFALQPTTVTLSTTATDPVRAPFSVTAQFGAPATTFTASHLALHNATATGLKGITLQNTLSGGGAHNLALKSDGIVVAWGYNSYGQCNVPTGLSGAVAIAGGGTHSLALKSDGTVVAWGYNDYSQCNVPAGLSGVVAVDGGGLHSLALKSDGTVVAWGNNDYGQCSVPAGLSGVMALAGGSYHSLALKSDRTVVAWGSNESGQRNVPAGLSSVVAIAGGGHHSLALKSDGTVMAWGTNGSGQCNVPAGLKVALPGLTRCTFNVKPYDYGPLTVQLPAGVVSTLGGVSNAASNLLQFNSLVPVSLSSLMVD